MRNKKIIIIIACCLLIITAVYQRFANKQDILSVLQRAEPAVADYNEVKGSFQTYELLGETGEFLSYAVISSASGYGGPIVMLTIVNEKGTVKNAVILEHAETPAYLERVVEAGYPGNLEGATVSNSIKENDGLDAVSGATMTTNGILAAVEKGIFSIGENQLGLDVPTVQASQFKWEDGAVVLLLVAAVLAVILKLKKLRVILLILSVIIIGFMTKSSITLANFMSIVAGKLPVFTERPIWYIFIFGILGFTLVLGKNIYCAWLCPFGAVQEGIYKALHLTKNRLDKRVMTFAGNLRWVFIWIAAMVALYFNNPGIAGYEPFAVFFGGEGPVTQWIIMGVILLMSIFILRIWCRGFCPVGAILNIVAMIKRKSKRFLQNRKTFTEKTCQNNIFKCSESLLNPCQAGYNRDKIKGVKLSAFNKFTVIIIILINLLIIGVIVENISLF